MTHHYPTYYRIPVTPFSPNAGRVWFNTEALASIKGHGAQERRPCKSSLENRFEDNLTVVGLLNWTAFNDRTYTRAGNFIPPDYPGTRGESG
ncbi:hypothetical protein TNIN_193101 [Trichonephila inaurata madagascariensis]|uniref:Uncharacterized protein n=1 Tax=Trichonephila inaurata madagascariensis TaxID=2747483 RepID=A0A8X6YLT1_9ARAC|nr:hypothetical protein TNIN_193101 [Trichonephila inaurata madagascariensis]